MNIENAGEYLLQNVKRNKFSVAKKSFLQHKLKIKNNAERKSRTRTLIQLGGILSLTPLLDICDIHLGDDLQLSHQDNADLLLGILSSLLAKLPDSLSNIDLDNFKHLGTSIRSFHAKKNHIS